MKIELTYTRQNPAAEAVIRDLEQATVSVCPGAAVETISVAAGPTGGFSLSVDGRKADLAPERFGAVPPRWLFEALLLRAVQPKGMLFLCVANSARSQMGEGVGRLLAPEGIRVQSAGSHPTKVRPEAAAVLAEIGVDTSGHFSKNVDEIDPSTVDTVVTLCAEEECPVFLGKAVRLHWGLPDPAAMEGDEETRHNAFRAVRDELRARLEILWPQ